MPPALKDGKLVREIAGHLKPWRLHPPSPGDRKGKRRRVYSMDEILKGVQLHIDLLSDVAPDHLTRKAIRRTREDAKRLRADIIRIERRIVNMSPEMRMRLKLVPPSDVVCHIHPLLQHLAIARKECDAAIKAATGASRINKRCAQHSWSLVRKFSEAKPTVSELSAFRQITQLLHQRVTGEPEKDLKQACLWMLRRGRG